MAVPHLLKDNTKLDAILELFTISISMLVIENWRFQLSLSRYHLHQYHRSVHHNAPQVVQLTNPAPPGEAIRHSGVG